MRLTFLTALILAPLALAAPKELKIETTHMPSVCPLKAQSGDKLSVHYTGKLWATGTKFDSSLDRGKPFTLTLGAGQVIRGWDEGLQGMCLKEKRTITIPSDKGYGASGAGSGVIPPNAALVFDVELVEIKPAKDTPREEL
ncbi:hypothetical protein BDQ17DRAFT_1273466 [Cyathus striatus]|nr:hypothetical protein BDQ17DRAFT_1273466 [Cyathus striatus]